MKIKTLILRLTTLILVMAGSFSCQKEEPDSIYGETDFYYTKVEGKEGYSLCELKIRKDKVIIKCKSNDEAKALSGQSIFISAYDAGEFVIATINPKKLNLDDLMKRQDVVSATYGLEYADGTLQYPSDQIFIKCKSEQTVENILFNRGLSKNVEAIELLNPRTELYLVTINTKLGDILRICRELYETGLCEVAEPSFYLEMKIH